MARRPSLSGLWLALGAALVLPAACGETDGSSAHFAGTVTYDHPAGEYHLHLLQPPWIPIRLPTETFFVVPPNVVTAALREDAALYSLHIYRQSTSATMALAAEAQRQNPPWDLEDSRTVSNGTTSGVETTSGGPTVFYRDAYIDDDVAGTSFRLHFTAKKSMAGDPMISQIIASFQPWPSSAHTMAGTADGGAK